MSKVKVKSHSRNGAPVRGYVRKQTYGERIGSILRGEQNGNVKLAVLASFGIGIGVASFFVLHTFMAAAEAAIFLVGASAAMLGIRSAVRHRRNGRVRHKKRAVTFSYRARKHHMMSRIRRQVPKEKYRRARTSLRKKHPTLTGYYDRWLGKYEVTLSTGKGKKKQARSVVVKGIKKRDALIKTAKKMEKKRKAANPGAAAFNLSSRQVFR